MTFLATAPSSPFSASTIPPIDPGPLDPAPGPREPDFDPEPAPDPDPEPLGPSTGLPGIDPGFPAPAIPGGPAPVTT
jgi:DNA polymerase-3 subunit gamma/tau